MSALPAATQTRAERPCTSAAAEHAAIAAALQVFEAGLREMRIGPHPAVARLDAVESDDRANLLAAIATRANLLALNTAIAAARGGPAGGGSAGAAAAIQDHGAQTAALTEALARHIAGLRP